MHNVQGLGQEQVFTTTLPDGDAGTRATIGYAKQLVAEGLRDPQVREMAVKFCRVHGAQPYDEIGELQAVFNGVLRNFDYRKHVIGAQSLQPVRGILRTRAGDCAELNLILMPALLGSIGYPTRAVTIKADPERPSEYSHVYIEAQVSSGQWIPLDVARSNTQFGAAPEEYWDRNEFPLTPGAGGSMNGYGMGNVVVVQRKPVFPYPSARSSRRKVTLTRRGGFPRFGLGDDDGSFNLSSFANTALQATPSILTGVAQVVKAQNTPGQPYSGVIGTTGSTYAPGVGVNLAGSNSMLTILGLLVAGVVVYSIAKR